MNDFAIITYKDGLGLTGTMKTLYDKESNMIRLYNPARDGWYWTELDLIEYWVHVYNRCKVLNVEIVETE